MTKQISDGLTRSQIWLFQLICSPGTRCNYLKMGLLIFVSLFYLRLHNVSLRKRNLLGAICRSQRLLQNIILFS